MYFHSVTVNNYKSIGDRQSEIIIGPGITAVIGKNERLTIRSQVGNGIY